MAETVIRSVIKFKRGLAADWTSKNPVLAEAEPGFELDTGKLKIGDGTTSWNNLSYLNGTFTLDLDTDCLIFNNNDELTLKGYTNASVGTYLKKGVNGIEWGNPGGGGSGNLNYIDEGYFAFDRAENIYDPDDTEQEGEPIGITFYYNVFHDNNESFSDNDLVTLNYFDDLLYISENEGSAPEYTPLLIPFFASWVQNAYGLYIVNNASNLKLSIDIYNETEAFEAEIQFDGATQIFRQEDNYIVDNMDLDIIEIPDPQGNMLSILAKYGEGFFQAGNRIGALTMKNIVEPIIQAKYQVERNDDQEDPFISDILGSQFYAIGPQYYLITDKKPLVSIDIFSDSLIYTDLETIGSYKDIPSIQDDPFWSEKGYLTNTIYYPFPLGYEEQDNYYFYTLGFDKCGGNNSFGAISTSFIYEMLEEEEWPIEIADFLDDLNYSSMAYFYYCAQSSDSPSIEFILDENNNIITASLNDMNLTRIETIDESSLETLKIPVNNNNYPTYLIPSFEVNESSINIVNAGSLCKIDFQPYLSGPVGQTFQSLVEKYGETPDLLFGSNGKFIFNNETGEFEFDGIILNCSDSGGSSSEYKMPYIIGYLELYDIDIDNNYYLIINDINGDQVSNTLVKFTRDSFVNLESSIGPNEFEELVENLLNKYLFVAGIEDQITFHGNNLE